MSGFPRPSVGNFASGAFNGIQFSRSKLSIAPKRKRIEMEQDAPNNPTNALNSSSFVPNPQAMQEILSSPKKSISIRDSNRFLEHKIFSNIQDPFVFKIQASPMKSNKNDRLEPQRKKTCRRPSIVRKESIKSGPKTSELVPPKISMRVAGPTLVAATASFFSIPDSNILQSRQTMTVKDQAKAVAKEEEKEDKTIPSSFAVETNDFGDSFQIPPKKNCTTVSGNNNIDANEHQTPSLNNLQNTKKPLEMPRFDDFTYEEVISLAKSYL